MIRLVRLWGQLHMFLQKFSILLLQHLGEWLFFQLSHTFILDCIIIAINTKYWSSVFLLIYLFILKQYLVLILHLVRSFFFWLNLYCIRRITSFFLFWTYQNRNDLWALGCTLYQMLSGTSPFKDASEWLIFQRIIARDIRFPDYFSEEARDLIDRLLVSYNLSCGSLRVRVSMLWLYMLNYYCSLKYCFFPLSIELFFFAIGKKIDYKHWRGKSTN